MYLAQKHTGKVFVPWFNTSEWQYVYNILCSEIEKNYKEALAILRLWKTRTPLLSAGLEGTLIILDAILLETDSLEESRVAEIYGLALLRFMNLCAANNERQGTFTKTVKHNELPKWLVDIRHDIAHDNRLPSSSLLKTALKVALDWVKKKYWKPQFDMIKDSVVSLDTLGENIRTMIKIYCRLNLNIYSGKDISEMDEYFINAVNEMIYNKFKNSKIDSDGILTILEESIRQTLSRADNKKLADKIMDEFVNEKALLGTNLKKNAEGRKFLLPIFRDLWKKILNVLFETGTLSSLLNKLLEATCDIMLSHNLRVVAALWISEIIWGLTKLQHIKEEMDSITQQYDLETVKSMLAEKYPEGLEFYPPKHLAKYNFRMFQEKILKDPNEYTDVFLRKVLELTKTPEKKIEHLIQLTEKLLIPNENVWENSSVSIEQVEVLCDEMQIEHTDNTKEVQETAVVDEMVDELHSVGKWKKLTDTRAFHGCPLGVLPHQARDQNPTLDFHTHFMEVADF